MAPDRITFRFPIDSQFRVDWDDFRQKAKDAGKTTAQLLQELVMEHLDDEAHGEESDLRALIESEEPQVRKVRKVRKRAPVVPFKPKLDVGAMRPKDTPKFRILALFRSLNKGDGVDPDELLTEATRLGIPDPQREMQKLVRRGILYIHGGLCRTAT
ncbi:MAG: hypothetical protein BEU05_02015 [Marine Group III euryarchaeote CG-Bathy2]|uniref:Uncharacterized protein n=1 Tax=Marine Group III euryarchaeote CG-Bathy2 TaxID=1889002 RepID=A0A1J5TDG5_9ARCH|nr:MAG: hypothetical protein BEU05_02015 [Marine Group III euryarchaeote CG-Bathy2]